jgi:probable rRNA maturation factor
MKVFIFNQTKFHIEDYRETITKVFDSIENDKGINVILLNSEDMIKLNKKYRGIDSDTDVLSFSYNDEKMTTIGDIFVSHKKIIEQSTRYGHSVHRELAFLVVHGFLHILGYDHDSKENEVKMLSKQNEILIKVGMEKK